MSSPIPPPLAQAPIGLFDSGVGGLSIWRALRQSLPQENLLYLADSQCAPYGDRSPAWIIERTQRMAQLLVDHGCKALVIACNTATLVAAPTLRATLNLPIIAIEPAIKPAAALSRSRSVALMATSRTLDSKGLQSLIDRYASDIEIIRIPCPGLADRVEALQLSGPQIEAELRERLAPALQSRADTLVLGCTHYPFLRPTIDAISGSRFHILEPSFAVAAQVHRRLQQANCLNPQTLAGTSAFISSAPMDQAQKVIQALTGLAEPTMLAFPTQPLHAL
ncbi:glutamate racemase [Alcaligenes ammonioxydans]|jgi:glutamate racemase|uniref:Glutamate racemase n=1 Tax=Alcaligenes ammonioxydans TaxID=2582914 RepID=A0ABX8SUZ0_9BURK|nr:glutamate racemase [Alcaligenes ammonioxydans]EJC62233.1 glutamate racemase [Alcaligenes faecalis subsp. faecalis NCIB 8687]QBH18751.1 glutamate racemase [Alcaligenes faecalis]MCH1880745.1 glutamate racemase [Alcaligenes ammonioxydans]QXX79856.1 glutamate racemase [Alcaligenes ammonioxydans]WGQ34814.1 glutamate racemase [Alcaligenes faecalis]